MQGSDLDNNAKRWRMVADVLNDVALAIELVSPLACLGEGDCNERWSFTSLLVAVEAFRQVLSGGARACDPDARSGFPKYRLNYAFIYITFGEGGEEENVWEKDKIWR